MRTKYMYPALFVILAAYFVYEFVSTGRVPNPLFLIVAGMVFFYLWDRERKKELDKGEEEDESKK